MKKAISYFFKHLWKFSVVVVVAVFSISSEVALAPYIEQLRDEYLPQIKPSEVASKPQNLNTKPRRPSIGPVVSGAKVVDLSFKVNKPYSVSSNTKSQVKINNESTFVYYDYWYDEYNESGVHKVRLSRRNLASTGLFDKRKIKKTEIVKIGSEIPFCLGKKSYALEVLALREYNDKAVLEYQVINRKFEGLECL